MLAGRCDLVRGLGAAGGADDHVPGAQAVSAGAEAQRALALENDEQLVIGVVRMERPGPLAGRHHDESAAQAGSAQRRRHGAVKASKGSMRVPVELDIGDIDDGPGWCARVILLHPKVSMVPI